MHKIFHNKLLIGLVSTHLYRHCKHPDKLMLRTVMCSHVVRSTCRHIWPISVCPRRISGTRSVGGSGAPWFQTDPSGMYQLPCTDVSHGCLTTDIASKIIASSTISGWHCPNDVPTKPWAFFKTDRRLINPQFNLTKPHYFMNYWRLILTPH